MPQIGFNLIMCYYRGDIFILHSPQIENLGNFGLKILGILHLNIQSTVSQVPMDFILFTAVSVFRVFDFGKQIRGLSRFLSKFHPASGFV